MLGAIKHLPISANVIDECSEAIFSGTIEITNTIFVNAETEAVDFLVSEVYPLFERASLSIVARSNEMFGAVKDSIHNHIRRGSLSSPDFEKLRKMLNRILADQEYLHVFKIYLGKEKAETILYAYNETVEIRERLTHLIDASNDSELNLSIFLYYINSFYDTYICLGAQFKIHLPNAIRGDFMMKLCSVQSADVDILKIIEEDAFQYMMREHLSSFLASAEYRQVLRAGRNSVMLIANTLDDPIVMDGHIEARKKSILGESITEKVDADSLKEMKMYLRSGHDELFGDYLETRCKLSYMQFSQSALRFQESSYSNDMERAIDCSNIFDRYISRNAEDAVALPEDIKLKIVRNHFRGSKLLFSEALDWVLDLLYSNYWIFFKDEINIRRHDQKVEVEVNKTEKEDYDSDDSSIESTRESMTDERKDEEQPNLKKKTPDGLLGKFMSSNQKLFFSGPNGSRRISTLDRRRSIRPIGRRNSIGAPKIADCDTEHIINKHKFGLSYRKIEPKSIKKPSQCIKDVLEHSGCCSIFKEYLERESGSQTLLFLLEVEEYRRIPQAAYQVVRARKIFNKFVHHLSIMPIPISCSIREEIEQNIKNHLFLPVLFKKATLQIHDYIEKVQFPKFQQSKEMEDVISILSQEASSSHHKTIVRRRSSIAMQSFEESQVMNLKTILQYQTSTRFFKDFCVRTYVNESLFFWLDAENYLNLPGSDYMKRTAHKICRKYILDDARMQINISSSVKQDILQRIEKPHRNLFKKAQEDIFKLLELDTYPKFLASAEADQLRKCIQNSDSDTTKSFNKVSSLRLNLLR